MPTVVITETLADEAANWLEQHAQLVWCPHDQPAELCDALRSAEAMIVRTYTQVNEALLERAPQLKVVGRAGVGLDNIDLAACQRRGVQVVYTPDANTQAVVEYVFGLILDAVRPRTNLPAGVSGEQFHGLRKSEVGLQLDHLSLGILGFGRIGKRIGSVAHAIGMKLHVCDVLPEAHLRNAVDYPFDFCNREDLYAASDIVTVHVDGRPENRHIIDGDALDRLHEPCLLINTARGMLVDAAALAAWAKRRTSCRAVLDVHDPEPPPADYPLYGLPNVRLLPHLASRTNEALANMSWVVRDVYAVLDGREPRYPATP